MSKTQAAKEILGTTEFTIKNGVVHPSASQAAFDDDIQQQIDDLAAEIESRVTNKQVDAERDRRMKSGFGFAGKVYDFTDDAKADISGASVSALAAIGAGAQPGDLRWHGGSNDFVWIAQDNSLTTMDAQTVFAFGTAAAEHRSAYVFASRALKDMDPIPADYDSDVYWPDPPPVN
ncbi:MAG: hypothetical protein AAF511_08490 [Pseudomonadota bacterium]